MFLKPNHKLIIQICNEEEPFWEEIVDNYIQLTDIAYTNNNNIEGNIYNDHNVPKSYVPEPSFLLKRQAYALFSSANQNIVEIGFNAGHSALLALTVNHNLKYTAIDIGHHNYVNPCFEFLKEKFNDRIDIVIGNSKEVVPNLFNLRPELDGKVDGWVVDGAHAQEDATIDIENIFVLSKNNDRLLFDDTSDIHLECLLKFYQMCGMLTPIANLLASNGNLAFTINKKD